MATSLVESPHLYDETLATQRDHVRAAGTFLDAVDRQSGLLAALLDRRGAAGLDFPDVRTAVWRIGRATVAVRRAVAAVDSAGVRYGEARLAAGVDVHVDVLRAWDAAHQRVLGTTDRLNRLVDGSGIDEMISTGGSS